MNSAVWPHTQWLAKASAFSGISNPTLARLAHAASASFFGRGEVIFNRGSSATGIHVVVSGEVKLVISSPGGAEHVVELRQAGDCFGDAAVLTHRPHKMTALAVTNCRLLHVSRHTILEEIARDHALAQSIIQSLSDRLYRRTSDLENMLFRNANGRVAGFIIEQLECQAQNAERRIRLPSRKGLIASHLHMTQEHFSRTLHDMSARGLIKVLGLTVVIIEEDGLRLLAA